MHKANSRTWTVTKFEFVRLITSRSTQVATLITIVILGIVLSLPNIINFFSKQESDKGKIIVVNESEIAIDVNLPEDALKGYTLSEEKALDKEEINTKFKEDSDLFGIFVVKNPEQFLWYTPRRQFTESPENVLYNIFKTQVQFSELNKQGVDPEKATAFISGPNMDIVDFSAETGKSQDQTHGYTYFLVFILYMALISFGQITATSVAYEKSTRTMELLVTSTDTQSLINGKVFGVGLLGIVQMAIIGVAYSFFYAINSGGYDMDNTFFQGLDMPLDVLVMTIICFILAYLAFAYIFAALGSLVTRSEEVGQVISPMFMLIIGVFFAAVMATFMPDKNWVAIVSYLPFAGPLLLFVRYSMLSLPVWEIALCVAVNIVYLLISSYLAAKVYRHGVLRYGKEAKSRDFFKILRQDSK